MKGPTWYLLPIALFFMSAGCTRAGFSVSSPLLDVTGDTDGAGPSLPAKVDEDCETTLKCAGFLICSGLPGQRLCRPPCSGDQDCGDQERCGKPVDMDGHTISVSRACLSTRSAKRYESCGVSRSCEAPLKCIVMPGESFWAFCGKECSTNDICESGEYCAPVLNDKGLCLSECAHDAECPGNFNCIGAGTTPDHGDYCLATSGAETEHHCDTANGVFCVAGNRCISILPEDSQACVPLCGANKICDPGRECFSGHIHGQNLCWRLCDPMASECPSQHICFPDAKISKAYCVPGIGQTAEGSVCGSMGPACGNTLMCVNTICRRICKVASDCPTGFSCRSLKDANKVALPWKACAPLSG